MSGPFGSTLKGDAYLSSGDIAFIRVQNIKGGFDINDNDLVYISNKDNEKIKSSSLQEGDLILSKVGNSIGYFAKVSSDLGKCNISENNIGIKLSSYSDIEKSFILTYLNAKYANKLVLRRKSGNAQPKINVDDLCRIPILIFPKLSENIHNLIQLHEAYLNQSILSYKQAEDILNKELGITNIENTKNYSVKSFSESFCKSKRLDAEYYQDKYDYFFKQIKSYKNGCNSVETYFDYVKTKCARNHSSYLYIEIGDVNIGNGDAYPNLIQTDELPDNAKTMTKIGDILVSTVRPNRGAITVIDSEGILVSGAFTVLRNKNCGYLSETLQVLFRTEVYRNWFLKFNVGTSYPVIKDKDVLNMKVPIISKDIQMIISDKVKKSCKLRKQPKDLLDKAVKAVELAIEKNEEYASQWLIENTNEIYHKDKY